MKVLSAWLFIVDHALVFRTLHKGKDLGGSVSCVSE